ncbi:hypothetical protein [Aquiflexum sp.]|uniref:hypothetical protein n=1 Tax=Aquiflexum sp. TaxID=1872584 RepID=UPI0035936F85
MFKKFKRFRVSPFLLVLIFLVFSCSKEDEQPPISIYGNYVVTAVETNGQFDFLNTGTISSDLKKQVEETQGFNYSSNLLTIISGNPDMVNVTLIEPNVLTTLPDNLPLIRYGNVPKTLIIDLEVGSKNFTIITPNIITEEIGRIEEMEMLNQFQIKVQVPQRIYDFNTQAWVNTIVTYTFNRLYV